MAKLTMQNRKIIVEPTSEKERDKIAGLAFAGKEVVLSEGVDWEKPESVTRIEWVVPAGSGDSGGRGQRRKKADD